MATVGYATLQVIPSLKGMEAQIQRQMGFMPALSQRMGGESGRGFIGQFGSQMVSGLDRIGGTVITWARRGFLTAGAVAGGVLAGALWGGLQRALDREDATLTFRRMGLDDRNIKELQDSIDQALRGTPITNPEGFALAGRFLAQGFAEADIPGIVSTIADMSSMANRSFQEMADVMVAAAGAGRITAAELNRMGDIPLNRVAEQLGMTEREMRDLASTGGLTAEAFMEAFAAIEEFSGAAKDATTRVAWANLKTQIASIGEQFLGPLLGEGGVAQQSLLRLRESISHLGPVAKEAGANFAEWLVPKVERFVEIISTLPQFIDGFRGNLEGVLAPATDKFGEAETAAYKFGVRVRELVDLGIDLVNEYGPAFAAIVAIGTAVRIASAIIATTPLGLLLFGIALTIGWIANNTDELKEAWGRVGEKVVPIMRDLAIHVTELADEFERGVQQGEGWGGRIVTITQTLGNLINWVREHVIPTLASYVEFVSALWERISEAASEAWADIQAVWDVVGGPLMFVMGLAWDVFRTVVEFVWDAVVTVTETALDTLRGILDFFTALIEGDWDAAWQAIKDIASTVWEGIKSTVEDSITFVRNLVDRVLGRIEGLWEDGWEAVKVASAAAWDAIKTAVSEALDEIIEFFVTLPGDIVDALSGLPGDLWAAGSKAGADLMRGMVAGIAGKVAGVVSEAISAAHRIVSGVRGAFGISSPSRVFAEIGSQLGEGLAVGFEGTSTLFAATADQFAERARASALDALAEIAATPMPGLVSPVAAGASPGAAGPAQVRVFIGDRELTDIVRVEVDDTIRPLTSASRQR